jgi:hypothetical protein
MTNAELLSLLREAQDFVGFLPTRTDAIEKALSIQRRIDAALTEREVKPTPDTLKWEEKDSNRHGISPHEADYSDDVFLSVEKHWLGEQWLFRVEYVGEAENEAEAKAKAIEYAGRLP